MTHFFKQGWLSTALLCAALPLAATAQEKTLDPAKPAASAAKVPGSAAERWEDFQRNSFDRTYKLRYEPTAADQNEVLTALRNVVEPATKIFLVPSSNTIVVHAPQQTQDQIAKLLEALDQPRPRYRLTYTVSEFDGNKKIGMQHFNMVLGSGQRNVMKQGSRIPIQAGYSSDPKNSQIVYVDVGMNFDATLTEIQGGAVLKDKVEQSSIAPDSMSAAGSNPVIRQTTLEGTTPVMLNKPLLLGSLDVPSSTHRFDVEVLVELAN